MANGGELDTLNAQKLYDAVSANFDVGTFDEFTAKMQTPDERKKFYDVASSKFDIGDYNVFETRLKKNGDSKSIVEPSVSGGETLPTSTSPSDVLDVPSLSSVVEGATPETPPYLIDGQPLSREEFKSKLFDDEFVKRLQTETVKLDYPQDEEIHALIKRQAESGSEAGDKWDYLMSGVYDMAAGVAGMKSYVTNIAREIGKPLGVEIPMSLSELMSEASADAFKAKAQQEIDKTREYEQGFIASISQGNYADAANQSFNVIIQSLPVSVTAALTGGAGSAGVALGTLGGIVSSSEYASSDQYKNLTNAEKLFRSTAIGTAEAAGELVTGGILNKNFKILKSGLKNSVSKAAQAGGEQAAVQVAGELAKKTSTEIFKEYGIDILKEAGSEGLTELAQMGTDDLMGVRNYELSDYINQGLEATAIGAVGGKVMGLPTAGKGVKRFADERLRKTQGEDLKVKVDQRVEQKITTPEQGEEIKEVIDSRVEAINSVPENLVKNTDVVDLVQEKQELEAEKKSLDPIFQPPVEVKIEKVDSQIREKTGIPQEEIEKPVKTMADELKVGDVVEMDVKPKKEIKPIGEHDGIKIFETNDVEGFHGALTEAISKRPKDGIQVDAHTPEYYKEVISDGGKVFLSEDKNFGMYVDADGYMGALFRNPESKGKDVSKTLLPKAVESGGRFMDAFATLEPLYIKRGFRPVARLLFNEKIADEKYPNWRETKLKDKPDVVFFAYDPKGEYKIKEGKYFEDYDEARIFAEQFVDNNESKLISEGVIASEKSNRGTETTGAGQSEKTLSNRVDVPAESGTEVTQPLSEVKTPEKSGESPIVSKEEIKEPKPPKEEVEPTKRKIPELQQKLRDAKANAKAVRASQKTLAVTKDVFRETEDRAKADRAVLDAYVDLAKEHIKEGIKTIEEFAKAIGDEINDLMKVAWAEATRIAPEGKERQFAEQILSDKDISAEVKTGLSEDAKTYIPITNALTQKEAIAIIDLKGEDASLEMIKDKTNDIKPAVRVMLAENLIKRYNILDVNKAIETAEFITEWGTEQGQGIQAFSVWQRLSPEGQLKYQAKEVAKQRRARIKDSETQIEKKKAVVKKVNKEVIEEILEGEVGKEITKATDIKLAKIRANRKKIIAKYKGRGLTLSSGGLTKEGIEFVGEMAKSYIEEGIVKVEQLVEKISESFQEVAKKSAKEYEKEISDIADKKLKQSDLKIIGGVKSIKDVIRKHYTEYDQSKKTLAEKLVAESALEGAEAKELSDKIQGAFDRIATRKKREALNKTLILKEHLQPKKTKLVHEGIIELSNLGAFSDAKFTEMYADKMGFPKLTESQAKEIMRLAEKIQASPEGIPKFEATEDLLKYQAKIQGINWGEVAQSVWYANVLSGYKTQQVNTVANLLNTGALLGVATAKNPIRLPFLIKGLWNGWGRGLFDAANVLQTGYSPIRGKIEIPSVLERWQFKWGKFNPFNYYKYVQRAMVAADTWAFEGLQEMRAYELALQEAKKEGHSVISKGIWNRVAEKLFNTKERLAEARAQAEKEGLKGIKFKRRVYDLMELSRPQKMIEDTHTFASRGTFNYIPEGTLGMITEGVNQMLNAVNIKGVRPLKFIIPFTRIISNVTNNSLDYTPIGFLRGLKGGVGYKGYEEFSKTGHRRFTKEQQTEAYIKATAGMVAMASLYALSEPDEEGNAFLEITANGTGDFRKNYELKQTGWQPYSVKIGDTWISYQYTPLAIPLAFIGNVRDGEKYNGTQFEDMSEQIEVAAFNSAKFMTDMTFLSSTSDFLGSLSAKSPDETIKYFETLGKSTVKSFIVPNLYNQGAAVVQEAFDMPAKEAKTFLANIYKDVPIARNSLNDKLNALGEPVIPNTDRFISDIKHDAVWDFIVLNKAWIGKPNKGSIIITDEDGTERGITDDEYYEFIKLSGQKIKEGVQELIGQDSTPQEVREAVNEIKQDARAEAKEELFNPQ